jgi:SagB-type dehydrogenase family enzyme
MIFKIFYALLVLTSCFSNIYAEDKNMVVKLKPASFKEENLKLLLEKRRSCRSFQKKALNLDMIAGVLWATCGQKYDSVTGATRTVPSAGACYPLELYLVVGQGCLDKLQAGVYRYIIEAHSLELVLEGDKRNQLSRACLGQDFIEQAPVSLIIVADSNRTTNRYGARGERYVNIEAGHASQNTYLAVANLGLNTVEVGAFSDNDIKGLLRLNKNCMPLIVMPIGYPIE